MRSNSLVKTVDLVKLFPVKRGLWEIITGKKQEYVHAVDNVSLAIEKGDVFAIAGESGSGKTTLGKLMLKLLEPTAGEIYFMDKNLKEIKGEDLKKFRREAQMIFQDPYASLNPRIRIGESIMMGVNVHYNNLDEKEKKKMVYDIMEKVGLTPTEELYKRYPHELSGGQRQRAVIARALILKPKFIVADEPVAMVDVSIRAQILDLLLELKKEMDLTYVIITHDLSVAYYISNKISIMYLGKMVEMGSKESIFNDPLHPYTQALIQAIPTLKGKKERKIVGGEVPSAIRPPSGCRFHPRCPYAMEICKKVEPKLIEIKPNHFVACHLYEK
jgi:peptide/nickel transport system ATP-binding protein